MEILEQAPDQVLYPLTDKTRDLVEGKDPRIEYLILGDVNTMGLPAGTLVLTKYDRVPELGDTEILWWVAIVNRYATLEIHYWDYPAVESLTKAKVIPVVNIHQPGISFGGDSVQSAGLELAEAFGFEPVPIELKFPLVAITMPKSMGLPTIYSSFEVSLVDVLKHFLLQMKCVLRHQS